MFVGSKRLKVAAAAVFFSLVAVLGGCSLDPQKGKVKYLESGKRYLKAGKYQEASIQFRNALKLDPRFAEAYYQLAQADLSLKQWNGAVAALRQTIDLDPQRVDAHVDKGRLYLASRTTKRLMMKPLLFWSVSLTTHRPMSYVARRCWLVRSQRRRCRRTSNSPSCYRRTRCLIPTWHLWSPI